MRKFLFPVIALCLLTQCREKPATAYKPSFDYFEIAMNNVSGKDFCLRVDSSKAFLYRAGGDMNITYGILPDSLLRYFDSIFERMKTDSINRANIPPCDDCSSLAIIVKNGKDSIGVLQGPEPRSANWELAARIDSFFQQYPPQFLYGFIYFQTLEMVYPPPPPIDPATGKPVVIKAVDEAR